MIATAKKLQTLPALPNVVPYNEMLFRDLLRVGDYDVKTRSWDWDYRGPLLLYTSKGRHHPGPCEAYKLDRRDIPTGQIVGICNLADVRPLTPRERVIMLQRFNNISESTARRVLNGQTYGRYIWPFDNGFFFSRMTRFKEPVPFYWQPGPVSRCDVPFRVVAKAIAEVGFEL